MRSLEDVRVARWADVTSDHHMLSARLNSSGREIGWRQQQTDECIVSAS